MRMMRAVLVVCAVIVAAVGATARDTVGVSAPSLTVSGSIRELKVDAGRAIVLVEGPVVKGKGSDCILGTQRVQVLAWSNATRKIQSVFTKGGCVVDAEDSVYAVALAGDNAAYVRAEGGLTIDTDLYVKSLTTGRTSRVA